MKVIAACLKSDRGTPFYSLGCVMAYAKQYKGGVLKELYDFDAFKLGTDNWIENEIKHCEKSDQMAMYLLSCYVWNHEECLDFAKKIKFAHPGNLIVVGGPQIPRREQEEREFFEANPFVDIFVRGEGEVTFAKLLEFMGGKESSIDALQYVDGLTFRNEKGDIKRTADRGRTKNLEVFPSPYLTGEYEQFEELDFILIETNRGCPFGCTFCDWGAATLSKIHQFDMGRILGELDFAVKNKIERLGVCDANFGILTRDYEITERIVSENKTTGYPKRFWTNFSKNASDRVGKIFKMLVDAKLCDNGLISIQTTDSQLLEVIDRTNVKTEQYEQLLEFLSKENIPLAADLMIGLPGQTIESFKNDLQYFFDRKVSAQAFLTKMIPNAPMSDKGYIKKYEMVVDKEEFLVGSYSFTFKDYNEMRLLYQAYNFLVRMSVLRYFLYYIQIEHGVKALDFIECWLREATENSDYPVSSYIVNNILDIESERKVINPIHWSREAGNYVFSSLDVFYKEISIFTQVMFEVEINPSAVECIFSAQKEVMPSRGKRFPKTVELNHDIVLYFKMVKSVVSIEEISDLPKLHNLPPGKIAFPEQKLRKLLGFQKGDAHNDDWELQSSLRFN